MAELHLGSHYSASSAVVDTGCYGRLDTPVVIPLFGSALGVFKSLVSEATVCAEFRLC